MPMWYRVVRGDSDGRDVHGVRWNPPDPYRQSRSLRSSVGPIPSPTGVVRRVNNRLEPLEKGGKLNTNSTCTTARNVQSTAHKYKYGYSGSRDQRWKLR